MWLTIWAFIAAIAMVFFFGIAMMFSLRIIRRLNEIKRKQDQIDV